MTYQTEIDISVSKLLGFETVANFLRVSVSENLVSVSVSEKLVLKKVSVLVSENLVSEKSLCFSFGEFGSGQRGARLSQNSANLLFEF